MKKLSFLFVLIALLSIGCNPKEVDMDKPVIDMSQDFHSPQPCAIVYRGESFTMSASFSDNVELGNYNIEIHNDFDHHSHSTDNVECDMDEEKDPVNPFIYNCDFVIPKNSVNYDVSTEIFVPEDVDVGDYHFMIRLTDAAGWQELKAVSIKIKDKE